MLQGGTAFASVIAAPARQLPRRPDRLARRVLHRRARSASPGWSGNWSCFPAWRRASTSRLGGMVGLLRNRDRSPSGWRPQRSPSWASSRSPPTCAPISRAVTGLDVNALSLVLLGLGAWRARWERMRRGFVLRSHLTRVLIGLPAVMAVLCRAADRPRPSSPSLVRRCWSSGASSRPHPRRVGHVDDAGHPARPRGRRRSAGGAHPVRNHLWRLRPAACCSTRRAGGAPSCSLQCC